MVINTDASFGGMGDEYQNSENSDGSLKRKRNLRVICAGAALAAVMACCCVKSIYETLPPELRGAIPEYIKDFVSLANYAA